MATTKTNRNATATYAWLMAKGRGGTLRIKTLTWGRLARIYSARSTNRQVRQAIERETRRCGYRPRMILGLNRWE